MHPRIELTTRLPLVTPQDNMDISLDWRRNWSASRVLTRRKIDELTLRTCLTSVSYLSSRHVHIPSSLEGFAPLIVPWRQDRRISNGTGSPLVMVFQSMGTSIRQKRNRGEQPYWELISLAPLALPLPHQLPSLLNPRKCTPAPDIGHNLQGYLAAHAQTRAIFPGEQRVDIRVEVGRSKVRVRRNAQTLQWQIHDTGHEPHDFRFVLTIETTKVDFGVCNCSGNFRWITFDEEMEVSHTVELKLEGRLSRLQKILVTVYPSRHERNQWV